MKLQLVALVGFTGFVAARASSASAYTQTGSCFENFGLHVVSCDDVSSICTSSLCSTSRGDILFSCYVPYQCSGVSRLGSSESRLLTDSYYGYDQTGSCFSDHNIEVASCSDVQRLCTTYSCSKNGSQIAFDCHTPSFSCSGIAAPPTTRAVPTTSPAGDCRADHGLLPTTCADVALINLTDCTCFTCHEVGGRVRFSCTAPFACSNEFPSIAIEEAASRRLTRRDFCLVTFVYITCVGVFAFVLWVVAPNPRVDPSKPPLTFFHEAVVVFNPSTALSVLAQELMNSAWHYVIEPNRRKDGSPATLLEFAASANAWIALPLSCSGHAAPRRMPGQLNSPMSKRRAVGSLAFDTLITVSLAFLLGTALNNGEACGNAITHDVCSHVEANNATAAMSVGSCEPVALTTMGSVVLFIAGLTKTVSFIADHALLRLKPKGKNSRSVLGQLAMAAALLVFSVGYSFRLAVSDPSLSARRYQTVLTISALAWVVQQASAVGLLAIRRVGAVYAWIIWRHRDRQRTDDARSAVVLPAANETQAEAEATAVPTRTRLEPTAPDFSMMLEQTEL